MTAPQEAGESGGPWLDMSRYPDTDPDTVLSPDDHDLLSSSLAVDDGDLPDSIWEHMLAVVTGDTGDDTADDPDAEGGPDADDDVLADDGGDTWSQELAHAFGLDDHDPGLHDAGTDHSDHSDHAGWDGGAV